jgi:beta-lactamase superfamily II metal-dependent hydrolase
MRATIVFSLALILSAAIAMPQNRTAKALELFVVDVEGGNAVLFVAPSGESVLIDSGNGGAGAVRDAERIMGVIKEAGLKQIDHLITTHYHGVPIREFIDHGPNVQPGPNIDPVLQRYAALHAKGKHTVAAAGDKVQVAGLDWRVVTAAGSMLRTPLPGAGRPNPYCADFKPQDVPRTEDDQSVGSFITFGRFRTVHLGDLTLNRQFDLMCPNNRLGTVDLLIAARHGNVNAELLAHALRPRVAITNNGTRKGGQPEAMKIFYSSPGLEDIWQMHFSLLSGQEYAVPGMFIANVFDQQPPAMPVAPFALPPQGQEAPPAPQHDGPAYYFKVLAQQDGTFTVTNTRNAFSKTYRAASGTN